MPTLTFTWHSLRDSRSCRKCASLHGYTWTFKDEMPNLLWHPKEGIVWDLTRDQSLAHGLYRRHCRCFLDITIDDSDLTDDLMQLNDEIAKLDSSMALSLSYIDQFVSMLEWM